jgi:hypothetical protein
MVARPGPARYAFTRSISPEWSGICSKKGLGGAYFDGIIRWLAWDANRLRTGFLGDFPGQPVWMGFPREDAAAWFSAILAKPACDG